MEKLLHRPSLPELYKFERQFEMKYGRKMTAEERRTFKAIEKLLLHPPEEDEKAS